MISIVEGGLPGKILGIKKAAVRAYKNIIVK
jgi:hypothetical protein